MNGLDRRRTTLAASGLAVLSVLTLLLLAPVVGTMLAVQQDINDLDARLDALRARTPDKSALQAKMRALRTDPSIAPFLTPVDAASRQDASALLSDQLRTQAVDLVFIPIPESEGSDLIRRRFTARLSPAVAGRLPSLIESASPPWFVEELAVTRSGDGQLMDVSSVIRTFAQAPTSSGSEHP
ncbi:hypothetical protein GGR25_001069 [Kaistia hirudinis]|uniref:Uncharacterized protein n=1 Tax=Kaistia hirudinis TaxID=1293440 RepID=A0A840AIL6_9HYPH|nr:hypothetical protein [Kaistia hirudinis]MBB3930030.1 hypothetical protein [Kaistia hirudinis]